MNLRCMLVGHHLGPTYQEEISSQDSYTMAFAEEVWNAEKVFADCKWCGKKVTVKGFTLQSARQ